VIDLEGFQQTPRGGGSTLSANELYRKAVTEDGRSLIIHRCPIPRFVILQPSQRIHSLRSTVTENRFMVYLLFINLLVCEPFLREITLGPQQAPIVESSGNRRTLSFFNSRFTVLFLVTNFSFMNHSPGKRLSAHSRLRTVKSSGNSYKHHLSQIAQTSYFSCTCYCHRLQKVDYA
jgi:hypothetical protein